MHTKIVGSPSPFFERVALSAVGSLSAPHALEKIITK